MLLRWVVIIASLMACGPKPESRPRPAGVQELCAVAGAAGPTLQAIDLWPIPRNLISPSEPDAQVLAVLVAKQDRIDLSSVPWAKLDGTRQPRLHRITGKLALVLFPVAVADERWSSVVLERAWAAYV